MLDRAAAIAADGATVADLAAAADLTAPVRSCPEWDLRSLVDHLGQVHRFWAAAVRAGDPLVRPLDPDEEMDGDLAAWMRAGTAELLEALAGVSDDAPCWTWWGDPRTAGAVGRHQVQETAVHRWDAQSVVGDPAPLDPEVAHDGVGEFLEIVLGPAAADLPAPVVLESTDTGGRWRAGPAQGDPAIARARASDLVLLLYGRLVPADVEVAGDPGAVRALLGAIDTT